MQRTDLPVQSIISPAWNPNEMDLAMESHLRESMSEFGDLGVLVVRQIGDDQYETLGGAQRLSVLQELGVESVPCVIVEADEATARLMTQALNNITGSDDFGRKAEALKLVLESVPKDQVMRLLPESAESLGALSSLTPTSLADHLSFWEEKRKVRLKHGTFQFASDQFSDVEAAIAIALEEAPMRDDNPNRRGNALHHICRSFIDQRGL